MGGHTCVGQPTLLYGSIDHAVGKDGTTKHAMRTRTHYKLEQTRPPTTRR